MPRPPAPLFAALLLAAFVLPARAQTDPAAPPAGTAPAEGVANAALAPDGVAAETTWATLLLGEDRIGWTRTSVAPLGEGPRAGTRTDTETSMTFRRFGQEISLSVELTMEDGPDGAMRSYEMVTKNPGAAPSKSSGLVKGGTLSVTSEVNGRRSTREIAIPADLKSPSYADTLLTDGSLRPGGSVQFKTFLPDLERVATVTLAKAAAPATVELPGGGTRELTEVVASQDVLPFPTKLYVDADGESVFETTDLLGQTLTTYEVSQEEALRALFAGKDAGGADMGFDTLVTVDPIPNVHATRRVVYDVAVEDAKAADLFLETASQQVEPTADGGARVTVIGLPVAPAATAGDAPEFLKSTRYLQADDPRVIAHAKAAAPEDASAGRIAAGCAAYVNRTLTDKNFSTALASAAEVAENLAGDCTEHSVLCAAMLRARGVPARVCVGLVAIPGRGQMGGHMWVEAYLDDDGPDGPAAARWVPLDPTMTGGAIGGGHLLLGRSALTDDASPVSSFLPMLEVIGRLAVKVVEAK